jgi:hypothetical protein
MLDSRLKKIRIIGWVGQGSAANEEGYWIQSTTMQNLITIHKTYTLHTSNRLGLGR